MPHHNWGDEDFDWDGLNDCVHFCWKWSRRFRMGGQIKEKYGTLRWYASLGHLSLHSLIWPGYVYCQFRGPFKFLWSLDIKYISPILQFLFGRPFYWFHTRAYNWIYQQMMKKHPHLRPEILALADYPELIDGATLIVCCSKHILDWDGEFITTWKTMGCEEHKDV